MTRHKIWKYALGNRASEVWMPIGAEPLHFAFQLGQPFVWVEVPVEHQHNTVEEVCHQFLIAWTGQDIPDGWEYVGTEFYGGSLVGHLYHLPVETEPEEPPGPGLSKPEPAPAGDGKVIFPLVITDIRERASMGKDKYGTHLRANNGRKPLVDAYQEALDLVMYLRQKIEEEK